MPRTDVLAAIVGIGFEGPLVIESSTTELREIATAANPMVATRHAASGARFRSESLAGARSAAVAV